MTTIEYKAKNGRTIELKEGMDVQITISPRQTVSFKLIEFLGFEKVEFNARPENNFEQPTFSTDDARMPIIGAEHLSKGNVILG